MRRCSVKLFDLAPKSRRNFAALSTLSRLIEP